MRSTKRVIFCCLKRKRRQEKEGGLSVLVVESFKEGRQRKAFFLMISRKQKNLEFFSGWWKGEEWKLFHLFFSLVVEVSRTVFFGLKKERENIREKGKERGKRKRGSTCFSLGRRVDPRVLLCLFQNFLLCFFAVVCLV